MKTNSRRNFIKATGLLGTAALIPLDNLLASDNKVTKKACTLVPTETAGPFPLDLSANTAYFRKDIREDRAGVQLNLKIRIVGDDNCLPMENLRVNIWHCDKDGLYSGYSQSGNEGQAGLTYLRGYQMTDVNGEAEFITIFPGWYQGRICHIHFQVFVSTSYAAISQLTFDLETKKAIYAANSSVYTKGDDPMTLASDNIFSDGYTYQITTPTANSTTGGYDAFLEVTVKGTGTTAGLGNQEKENAKNFLLGQNFPNPYTNFTSIPFNLIHPSDVVLDLFDLQGKKVRSIQKHALNPGEHVLELDMKSLNLPTENYVYQLNVSNKNGNYADTKLMTATR